MNPAPFPVMTAADAEAIGFARFNECPHLVVDVPDGGFTVTTRTTEGNRTTLYFGPSRQGGPATFIDIQYHDAGATIPDGRGEPSPVFDMLTIGRGGYNAYDSRDAVTGDKPSIAVILLEPARTMPPKTSS